MVNINSKIKIIGLIFLLLLSISFVSASEDIRDTSNVNADIIIDESANDSIDGNQNDITDSDKDMGDCENGSSDIADNEREIENNYNENESFSQLNQEIEDSDELFNLSQNYTYYSNDSELFFNKSMTINGNKHTLNETKSQYLFEIGTANGVILNFYNINFLSNKSAIKLNFNNDHELSAISILYNSSANSINSLKIIAEYLNGTQTSKANINFINSNFLGKFYNQIPKIENNKNIYSNLNRTEKISDKVRKLAISIVGNSKGTHAAKKLAEWICKNTEHEVKEGFYQSALTTLNRKKGNCCTRTNLFLQMCEAVGVTKACKVYFVHVGTMQFHYRHFFAAINDICVDVCLKKPWKRASIGTRGVCTVTEYPYLPLTRTYN